jgi:histidinol-phosphate aminotransferase
MFNTHGGTDSATPPTYDFSSNANFLGPPAHILKTLHAVNPTPYPDPAYTKLRAIIGGAHDVDPERILVGAGASEIILRIARFHRRVIAYHPSFSEYERAAYITGAEPAFACTKKKLIRLAKAGGVCFICQPNNPTGELYSANSLDKIAAHSTLVLDCAYAPLSEKPIALHPDAILLYSPNKSFNLTGLRAAYAILPNPDHTLANAASAWVLDAFGAAFLSESVSSASREWLCRSLSALHDTRRALARQLQALGLQTLESPSSFFIAKVGDAAVVTQRLRENNIKVRDCSSFGMPEWIRLSAQKDEACKALIHALPKVISR